MPTEEDNLPNIFIETINQELVDGIGNSESITESDEKEEISTSEAKEFLNRERDSYIKIDEEFGRFLKDFVDEQEESGKQKIHLKEQFFWFIMIGFLVLLFTPVFIILSVKYLSDSAFVISFISVLVELVSAIIVLPKIIAEYLFNKEEDESMMEIIKNMQDYNEKKHLHIEKSSESKK